MTELKLTPMEGGQGVFLVVDDYTIRVNGRDWLIPAGTMTNGCSIPRPVRWLFPAFHSHYTEACVLHDLLIGEWTGKPLVGWGEAANIMATVMRGNGAPLWKVWSFKGALMVYGKVSEKY